MKIIIPEIVKKSISTIGNKTAQKSAYKIYSALFKLDNRKNAHGYFSASSNYLKSINVRYYKVIDKFIEDGIIKYFVTAHQGADIFTTVLKKHYSTTHNTCMAYKFLVDITVGEEIEVDMENPNKKRWFDILKNTLTELNYENIQINRDDFGRRVHHSAIHSYKTDLKDKGLSVIDAKCSQPRLLYLLMKEKGIIDPLFNSIFEEGKDFYFYLINNLNIKNRTDAKDLFMFWLNADGYVPNFKIHSLFPVVSKFIKSLKSKNYKDSSSFLQRMEAKIWIDDLLENIPTEFALSIHDSLIIKNKDAENILAYCKAKYPQIEFEMKEL